MDRRPDIGRLKALSSEILENLKSSQGPGVAIGLAHEGHPEVRAAVGCANVVRADPLTAMTRMSVGSITKQFTALAILLACEEGRCRLDQPLGDFVPEVSCTIASIPIHMLLTHTSGIRDAISVKLMFSGIETAFVTADQIVGLYTKIPTRNDPPGMEFRYNNGGYLLLSRALQSMYCAGYAQILAEKIFRPNDMRDTLVRHPEVADPAPVAASHSLQSTGQWVHAGYQLDFAGAGAMYSTIDDLLNWMARMTAPAVGSDETWRRMTTPVTLPSGSSTRYGCGLNVFEYKGYPLLAHAGGGIGCNAMMLKIVPLSLDICVLSNSSEISAQSIAFKLVDEAVGQYTRRDAELQTATPRGVYHSETSGRIVEFPVGTPGSDGVERTILATVDSVRLPFAVARQGRLLCTAPTVDMDIDLCAGGEGADLIQLTAFGRADCLRRVPHGNRPALPQSKRFCADELGSSFTLVQSDGAYTLKAVGQFGFRDFTLTPVADGIWNAVSCGVHKQAFVVRFDETYDVASITGFFNKRLQFIAQDR